MVMPLLMMLICGDANSVATALSHEQWTEARKWVWFQPAPKLSRARPAGAADCSQEGRAIHQPLTDPQQVSLMSRLKEESREIVTKFTTCWREKHSGDIHLSICPF